MQRTALPSAVAIVILAAFMTTPGCDSNTDDDPLDRLVSALSSKREFQRFASFRYESEGTKFFESEGHDPGDTFELNRFKETLTYDLSRDALRIDRNGTILFEALAGTPQAFGEILVGNRGAVTAGESLFSDQPRGLPSDRVAASWRRAELLNPLLLLLRARPDFVRFGPDVDVDGQNLHTIIVAQGGFEFAFVLSRRGTIVQLRTTESHRLLRDVPVIVSYGDWQRLPSTPLRLPMKVQMRVGGVLVLEETRTNAEFLPLVENGIFEFPAGVEQIEFNQEDFDRGNASELWHASFSALGIPLDGILDQVNATELAPGVMFVKGALHNSIVVEQASSMVVIEAPIAPERSAVIADWIDRNYGKPVSHVIPTHFHQDHAAGAREFAGAGASIVAVDTQRKFWTDVLAASSAIIPDRQQATGAGTVTSFASRESLSLSDATNSVTAYHIAENPHSADMLLVAVDNGKSIVVFVSDIYGPFAGSFVPGGPESFLRGLQEHGLIDGACKSARPIVVVGGHGGVEPLTDSLTAIADAGTDVAGICGN